MKKLISLFMAVVMLFGIGAEAFAPTKAIRLTPMRVQTLP